MKTLMDVDGIDSLPHAVILIGDRVQGEREVVSFVENELGLKRDNQDFFFRSTSTWLRDDSSDFISFVSRRSVGSCKVALISTSQFSDRSQDPLLKTIEEPQGKAKIFITVEREEILLETIRSRATVLGVCGVSDARVKLRGMAREFVVSPLSKRITMVAPLSEKIEGDSERIKEEKRKQKEDARVFVQELALTLSEQKNKEGAEAVILASKLLSSPSPNLRLLLEHIAFSLPTSK